jgi:hypothetical protein
MTELSVADVLSAAAGKIEAPGAWMQGAYGLYEGSTCWCAVGAIGQVLGVGSMRAEAWIDEHARDFLGMYAEDLEAWNDSADRTQAQAVAKLREAAYIAGGSSNV